MTDLTIVFNDGSPSQSFEGVDGVMEVKEIGEIIVVRSPAVVARFPFGVVDRYVGENVVAAGKGASIHDMKKLIDNLMGVRDG